jgi:Asp-tRNA(Asn)/Glu-tRNA(Gln) amidotransferase A subunit family amidase
MADAGLLSAARTASPRILSVGKRVEFGEDAAGMSSAPPSSQQIQAAEQVLGVAYADAEREQMREALALQIGRARLLRGVKLGEDDAPATRFDPRLPGFTMPIASGVAVSPVARAIPDAAADIAFASLRELSHWLRAGQISSARLTELYLDRIFRHGPRLECIALATPGLAMLQAQAADAKLAKGVWLGPLHGVPYGLKDLFDTRGLPTTWGAETHLGRLPDRDAAVVERLAACGAVLVAKTTLGALAYGDIWHGGRTRNPWNPDEGSAGSSAGSGAGAAAGLFGFAIATETLGSIVNPATRCGAAGLRPTFGRVSRFGAMPLSWTMDKIGAICRSVEDTALVLDALNGFDPRDPGSIDAPFAFDATAKPGRLRVGYFAADFADAADAANLRAIEALGHELVELHRAQLPYDALGDILTAESAAVFEELTLSDRDDLLAWQEPWSWPATFRRARFLSAVDHVNRDRLRRRTMLEADRWFGEVDVIAGAPQIGPMPAITNMTGHPCLCVRSDFRPLGNRSYRGVGVPPDTAAGPTRRVPHAIWLWGRLFEEGAILQLGLALERALGIADRRPEGFA